MEKGKPFMKKTISVIGIFLGILLAYPFAGAQEEGENPLLWGKQTAGKGALSKAKIDGNILFLMQKRTITRVEGDAAQYCIWKVPAARAFICGNAKKSLVGVTLLPGRYKVIPGLGGKDSAEIRIELE